MKSVIILVACLVATSYALPQKSKAPKGFACDVCVTLVTEIDKILVSQPTIDAAIEAIGQLCDGLGGVAGICHSFVETYLPQVIEYIVDHQLDPQGVCVALTLCEAPPKKF